MLISWIAAFSFGVCAQAAPAPSPTAIVDYFYNMEFEAALAAGTQLARQRPTHPAGMLYRAIAHYQQWIAEGMTVSETYQAFDSDMDSAEAIATELLKSDPAQGHYYLGAALGFRSRANAARRRYIRALPDAISSITHLKKALALDPALTDALLGLGMYHYFADRIPNGARPLAHLLVGETGDRKRGLEELWTVANSTGLARMEARSVLASILSKNDEADWDGAESLLGELMSRYPRNPVYRQRRAYVAIRRGRLEEALGDIDPNGAWLANLHPATRAPAHAWAVYRTAECRLLQGQGDDASRLLATLDTINPPQALKDWILLRKANALDLEGHDIEADRLYARVRGKAPAALARIFIQKRFHSGPQDIAPYFAGY